MEETAAVSRNNGAQVLIDTLNELGIDRIFLNPGIDQVSLMAGIAQR